MQESIFCHDNCKKPYQDYTSASRFCGIVLKNNGTSVKFLCFILCYCNCHSNYEYDIGNCISWTVALSFSLSYVLLYLKFPCGIIVVEVWNSTYVIMIIKCVFVLKSFSFFWDIIYNSAHSWWKKYVILNTLWQYILLFYNSVFPMWIFHQRFTS